MEITFETHETTIIRFGHRQTMIFCGSCQTIVPHFSVVQAGRVLSLSEREISRLASGNRIHAAENADGLLMLCGNSLAVFKE